MKLGVTFLTKSLPRESSGEPISGPAIAPELQLREAMAKAGIQPPDYITMDGRLHRFASGDKRGDKSGWYVAYIDGVPAGSFGCWRTLGEGAVAWRADIGRALSYEEERAFAARQAEAKRVRDTENARAKAEGAARAKERWESASTECMAHPYIQRKGLKINPGWRMTADGRLVSPMIVDGQIVGTQSIGPDGEKKFDYGSTSGGAWWPIGGNVHGATGRVYVAEGVATAASIHEATGNPVVVSYSAGNMPAAAKILRAIAPACEIVVVGDYDAGEDGGVGARRAREAAQAVGGVAVVMPPWPTGTGPNGSSKVDANDYAFHGGDLRAFLENGELAKVDAPEDWLVSADDWSQQPAPIGWLVKHWLQEDALIMVHGPSGGGKTFVVLDLILRMAGGEPQWAGKRVKPGTVVYLAGEGHQGLRGRIAGWKHHHAIGKLDMWLTRGGCDLNTPEGYAKVESAIEEKKVKPAIIVVDTLHRFLMGDENKAQDAKTMLDACAKLMTRFKCSVLLVHHTGVSEEAQHRARGSSAWRGALDIEISVTPSKIDGEPLEIAQKKSKDAELAQSVYARLQSIVVPGWLDEDGEQVSTAIVEIDATHVPTTGNDGADKKPKSTASDKALHKHKQTMRDVWLRQPEDKRETNDDGYAYISGSALRQHLQDHCGKSEKTAYNISAPGGDVIESLQNNGFCRPYKDGWVITDNEPDGALQLGKLLAKGDK